MKNIGGIVKIGCGSQLLCIVFCLIVILLEHSWAYDIVYNRCMKYFRQIYKESRAFIGEGAPYHYFMGQIEQESACKEGVISFDGGKGLAQFMDDTAEWIHFREKSLREFGVDPQPFNPRWAIRALILYDKYCYDNSLCKGWHYAFRAYNGGLRLLNKEIIDAGKTCDTIEIAKYCKRRKIYLQYGKWLDLCKVNIEYPYKIFERAKKYERNYVNN